MRTCVCNDKNLYYSECMDTKMGLYLLKTKGGSEAGVGGYMRMAAVPRRTERIQMRLAGQVLRGRLDWTRTRGS